MADFTLRRPDTFPPGTTIHLFEYRGWNQPGRPPGEELATLIVDSNGGATVTGLGDNMKYVIWGVVNGDDRYVRFSTPGGALSGGGGSGGGGGGGGGGTVVIPGGLFRFDWAPNTQYRKGDYVLEPTSRDTVTATADHTSSNDYIQDRDELGMWDPLDFAPNALTAGTYGQPNGTPQLDENRLVRADQLPITQQTQAGDQTFTREGVATVGTGVRAWVPSFPGTLQTFHGWASKAPDGQALISQLVKNGTVIATATVSPGAMVSPVVLPSPATFVPFDRFTINRTQVGIQPPGGPEVPSQRLDSQEPAVANTTSITANKPAGIQPGDWHLITIRGSNADLNTPTGLTKIGTHLSTSSNATDFYWRQEPADGSGPTSWTFTSATAMASVFVNHQVWDGVDPVAPVDGFTTQVPGTNTTVTPVAGLTTVSNNAVIVWFLWLGASRGMQAPTGYSPVTNFNGTSGTSSRKHVASIVQATPGAADVLPATISGAGTNAVLLRLALKPYIVPPQAVWSPGEDLGWQVTYTRT